MDDNALSALVAHLATTRPRSREGVNAVLDLERAIANEPEFATPRLIVGGRGGHGWLPRHAAHKLLSAVRAGRAPEDAVAWFRKVPTFSRATGGAVKLLYGVKCEETVPISGDIELVSVLKFPASSTLEWILKEHEESMEIRLPWGPTFSPFALLFRKGVVESIFRQHSDSLRFEGPPATWFDELDEAARLLTLVPKAMPIEAAHWFHYDDPEVAHLAEAGVARQGPELPATNSNPPVDVTAETVTGLFDAYRRLKRDDAARVNLALERIIRSRCQFVPGNRSIDLAIALEVLFVNADRDEHSYKISLRAARLLHQDIAARQRTFMQVRRLYDMRSSMVHTGGIKNDYPVDAERVPAHEIVEAVDAVCVEAIRAFLKLGQIPTDWRPIELR